ncbi:transposase domain-containing protein [Paraflavitalea speifideaquila]|uniref:transposase domain-containing protein n=1 Tax=Paraflavitalea speifideaquila TaxID=3076558 RepID=UPI00331305DE
MLVTCKLNTVNPYEWLREVLSHNINEMTTAQLRKLLPHQWKKHKPSLRLKAKLGN